MLKLNMGHNTRHPLVVRQYTSVMLSKNRLQHLHAVPVSARSVALAQLVAPRPVRRARRVAPFRCGLVIAEEPPQAVVAEVFFLDDGRDREITVFSRGLNMLLGD